MFCEKEMAKAIAHLIRLFDNVPLGKYPRQNEDDPLALSEYTMPQLCQALYHHIETVFSYEENMPSSVTDGHYGKELFGQRAILLTTALQDFRDNQAFLQEHLYELWMLEDMTFAVVDVHITTITMPREDYHTEYRGIKWMVADSDDLPFHPADFHDSLAEICIEATGAPTYTI